jgi:hypothetical protein
MAVFHLSPGAICQTLRVRPEDMLRSLAQRRCVSLRRSNAAPPRPAGLSVQSLVTLPCCPGTPETRFASFPCRPGTPAPRHCIQRLGFCRAPSRIWRRNAPLLRCPAAMGAWGFPRASVASPTLPSGSPSGSLHPVAAGAAKEAGEGVEARKPSLR